MPARDVTNYAIKQEFSTLQDLYLFRGSPTDNNKMPLLVHPGYGGTPPLSEFTPKPNNQARAVITTGTKLTIIRIEEHSSPTIGSYTLVIGQITSGSEKGQACELNYISKRTTHSITVDHNTLENEQSP